MAFLSEGNKEIVRKLLVTYVNTGSTASKVWKMLGYKVEEANIEFNPETEKITDILGVTHTDITKTEPQLSVEPYTLTYDDVLGAKLHDIMRRNALEELSQFEVMNVYGYAGASGAYEADLHQGCTIEVVSVGGSTRVGMPINIHYSNDKILGTTNVVVGTTATPIVFTPAV